MQVNPLQDSIREYSHGHAALSPLAERKNFFKLVCWMCLPSFLSLENFFFARFFLSNYWWDGPVCPAQVLWEGQAWGRRARHRVRSTHTWGGTCLVRYMRGWVMGSNTWQGRLGKGRLRWLRSSNTWHSCLGMGGCLRCLRCF